MKRQWGNGSPDEVLHCKIGGAGQESVKAHFSMKGLRRKEIVKVQGGKKFESFQTICASKGFKSLKI